MTGIETAIAAVLTAVGVSTETALALAPIILQTAVVTGLSYAGSPVMGAPTIEGDE